MNLPLLQDIDPSVFQPILNSNQINKQFQNLLCSWKEDSMMMNCTITESRVSQMSFPDDTSSNMSSSIGLRRISRKPNQSTTSRRSLSRRSSSEKSIEKSQVNSFFIKMSSMDLTTENSQTFTRNSILVREENRNQKKRSPTPVPGHLSRKRQIQKQEQSKEENMQNQMVLMELQTKYHEEKEKVKALEKKTELLQRDLKAKIKKIQDISELLVKSEEREKDMAKRAMQYKSILTQNQTTISQTKNKLQRLKNTIKINRYSELECDNAKLRKEKEKMTSRITELESQNKDIDQRCIFLQKQIYQLKKNNLSKKRQNSPAKPKHDSLEKVLHSRDQYSKQLQSKVGKLQIKLNFLNRKKLEEIQQIKEKKDKELHRLRSRLINLNKELNESRKANQKQKKSEDPLCVSMPITSRKSLMSSDTWATHEEIFCLSLSPEHCDC